LLAKRRGEEKAATLTLRNEEEKKKWKVLDASGQQQQGKLMREIENRLGVGGGGELSGAETEREELPDTPGWVPRLTPTRKGDELFLSVR
jgi:hypothetical protein